MKIPFSHFNEFILRTPYFPFDFLEFLFDIDIAEKKLKQICEMPDVREAIFIASPGLYSEIVKWLKDGVESKKKEKRLYYSLLKYIVRMSSRTTPFGLFSGISTGRISDKTDLELYGFKYYRRHTRLDMNFLCLLSDDLLKDEKIRKQLKYYPNSSLYRIGKQFRYIEYRYKNAQRSYHIVELEKSNYLDRVLEFSKKGKHYCKIVKLLISDEITKEEAEEFIDELISNQVLVSELEPNVTGKEFSEKMIEQLSRIKGYSNYRIELKNVSTKLLKIDRNEIGSVLKDYDLITEKLKSFKTKFDIKYLYQIDMKKQLKKDFISEKIIEDITKGIFFLKKISKKYVNQDLKVFKERFFERYEQREIPLVKVLDVETGIGYGSNDNNSGDISPLVTDLILINQSINREFVWSEIDSLLFKKYIEAIKSSSLSIYFSNDDFKKFEIIWDDVPDTFAVMADIFRDHNGDNKIYIKTVGGSSAVNLLGRFCLIDEKVNRLVNNIIKKEELLNPQKIFAEIVHLPQARTGNILMRPSIREYEIPYLARSSVPSDRQIKINDIMVSIRENKIILRSKNLDREVIPRLGTAHNYSNNSLPIYKFLCDLQMQDKAGGFEFSWGPLSQEYEFLPRVEFENIILFPATWNLKVSEFLKYYRNSKKDFLISNLKKWREEKKIPSVILLTDGDNKLLFNFENHTSIETFYSLIKNRNFIKLEEFLFGKYDSIVKGEGGKYVNEFIFSFFRNKSDKIKHYGK